jgi:hypothetical protein
MPHLALFVLPPSHPQWRDGRADLEEGDTRDRQAAPGGNLRGKEDDDAGEPKGGDSNQGGAHRLVEIWPADLAASVRQRGHPDACGGKTERREAEDRDADA